jgi:hypothetical protein
MFGQSVIPLQVEAVFEDGRLIPNQAEVLEIVGCPDQPVGTPPGISKG